MFEQGNEAESCSPIAAKQKEGIRNIHETPYETRRLG
jgi:hypothetical protein